MLSITPPNPESSRFLKVQLAADGGGFPELSGVIGRGISASHGPVELRFWDDELAAMRLRRCPASPVTPRVAEDAAREHHEVLPGRLEAHMYGLTPCGGISRSMASRWRIRHQRETYRSASVGSHAACPDSSALLGSRPGRAPEPQFPCASSFASRIVISSMRDARFRSAVRSGMEELLLTSPVMGSSVAISSSTRRLKRGCRSFAWSIASGLSIDTAPVAMRARLCSSSALPRAWRT